VDALKILKSATRTYGEGGAASDMRHPPIESTPPFSIDFLAHLHGG
jgi:hypothetical protein